MQKPLDAGHIVPNVYQPLIPSLESLSYPLLPENSLTGATSGLEHLHVPTGHQLQQPSSQFQTQGLQIDPVLRFSQTIQILLAQDIPKIAALARNALDGINHAYESHINPNETAATLQALHIALRLLYETLRESGVGALLMQSENETQATALLTGQTPDPRIEDLSKRVNDVYSITRASQERAGMVLDLLKVGNQATRPIAGSAAPTPGPNRIP